MESIRRESRRNTGRVASHLASHVLLIGVSAGLAVSLPRIVGFLAEHLLVYWSFIANEKLFLVSTEVVLTIGLVLLGRHCHQAWSDRRRAAIVTSAGLLACLRPGGSRTRRYIRRQKARHGLARDVMILGCTGFRTFVKPEGDLHEVLHGCRSARVLLLSPLGAGMSARARSLRTPDITPERLQMQIRASIAFLTELKGAQRDVRLKLYNEAPLLKLAVLGDYIWLKHYHSGLSADALPEYIIENAQRPGGLYFPLYEYFVARWDDPAIPEVDLETGELVLRDAAGREVRRALSAEVESALTAHS